MAKKIKSEQEKRKSFITRAIVYSLLTVLFVVLAIVYNTTGIKDKVYYATIPAQQEVEINDGADKKTFYSEIGTDEDGEKSLAYYYMAKDGNGKDIKMYLKNGAYRDDNGTNHRVSVSFVAIGYLISKGVSTLLGVLIALMLVFLVILGIRYYRFSAGLDELTELKKQEKREKKAAKKAEKKAAE